LLDRPVAGQLDHPLAVRPSVEMDDDLAGGIPLGRVELEVCPGAVAGSSREPTL